MSGARRRAVVPQIVTLPDGGELRIRRITRSDGPRLAALFDGLDDTDLYRRFFQVHPPPARVVAAMTSPGPGGIGLVAEKRGPGRGRRIVAEAAYAPLPDGDGELAITVARDARGWLGPYLFDVLLRSAAAEGVANLQADVLCDNRRMLALVRSRGYAVMEHSEQPAIVRVVVSTTGHVPSWPVRQDRPRLLVEAAGGRWHGEAAARAAGLDLLVCPGPGARWARCPALDGRPCPLASGADVVVDAVDPATELGARLLRAHESVHAVPVHVETQARRAQRTTGVHPRRVPSGGDDLRLVRHLAALAAGRRAATTPVG